MRIFLLSFLTSAFLFSATAQTHKSTALILIDIQDFYFSGGAVELDEPQKAGEQAKQLLAHFRKNDRLVIHVRHNFQPGGDIHNLVKPIEGEKIISKDEVNAFLNTDLNNYLKENNIEEVVLCGMQTHMCLEAGTRAAHDLGYKCTVVEDACATRDLTFSENTVPAKQVHYSTLATLKNYAKVVSLEEFLK
ncbi:MAG: cysteine hydrolase [Bacteroidetes bacterium]|nr:cysteine hydrolase [Bacteroidota bacterium]